MKKLIALVLVLMLFVPAAFAAPTYEEALPGYYKPPVMNEGQYPIKGENLKLTYWMPINSGAAQFISSYEDNPAYQLIQENTGVDIEFIHPAAGTDKESFQLLFGQELPDMILFNNGNWYTGDLAAMYEDGIIIDLMPYLEQYAPQYKEIVDSNELCQAQAYADGKALGFYKMTYADKIPYIRVNINKDWMTEAGLAKEPQTIAEYEQYFQWILDNKEGVAPFHFNPATASAMNCNVLTGAFDFLKDWYVTKEDPNKVAYWANSPQLKDFLTLMNEWYTKGYISKDFLSESGSEVQAKFDAGKVGAVIDSVDATMSRLYATEGHFTLTNCPYLTKEPGQILGSNLAATPIGDGGEWVTVVTTACKQPEIAVQYLNYCYTYEGSIIPNFGVEGEAFFWGEDNNPVGTDLIKNNPRGMTISDAFYAIKIHFGAKYCYPDDITYLPLLDDQMATQIRTKWNGLGTEDNYLQLAPIKLTAEEAAERANLMSQVDTYAKEMMIKFITGAEPLDNFDAYVESVNNYGLLDAIEITQAALNRFFGRE